MCLKVLVTEHLLANLTRIIRSSFNDMVNRILDSFMLALAGDADDFHTLNSMSQLSDRLTLQSNQVMTVINLPAVLKQSNPVEIQ